MRQISYDADNRPLCNAVAKCTTVAVAQAEEECTGCDDVATGHAQALEEKRVEHARYERSVDTIRQELARRADAGEPGGLAAVEEVAVRLGLDKVRELGEAIEALNAAHAAVLDAHTHPVFACGKHKGKLPAR